MVITAAQGRLWLSVECVQGGGFTSCRLAPRRRTGRRKLGLDYPCKSSQEAVRAFERATLGFGDVRRLPTPTLGGCLASESRSSDG
ncbi:hypothetical protein BST45_15210 [Mycobacterium shinjukuense]|nr:hypothetical protein BST45_15210 [Mycobacterium shinjukuense]